MLEVLLDLWACLRAAHHLYLTLHWQAKGPTFYGDHLLFERLYSARAEEIDGLAELIAGTYGSVHLDPVQAWNAASDKITAARGGTAPGIAEMVLASAEAANRAVVGESVQFPGAVQNFIQGVATAHLNDLYLLRQRFAAGGGSAPPSPLPSVLR